ncbi:MAG: ribosome-associated translation inhibitor RaiA [Patescibacteria group bacterium]
MQINIRAKNYELTEQTKDYVEEKVGNMEKYISGMKEAHVILEKDSHHNKGDVAHVEISLHSATEGEVLMSEDTASDMHEALDNAVGKLKHVIEKYKGTRNQVDKEAVRQLRETE